MRYTSRALSAVAYLFRPYNDIDVYVEDVLNRNMYQILIERALDGKAKVKRVFPLDGRNEVLKACESDQDDGGRNRVYIIDGDMDLVLEEAPPNLKRLYRLGVYASENLVVSSLASIEVAFESMPEIEKEELERILSVPEVLREAASTLRPLLVIYAVKHFLGRRDNKQIHITTNGLKVEKLSEDVETGIEVSEQKVEKQVEDIRARLVSDYGYSMGEVQRLEEAFDNKLGTGEGNLLRYLSGKTYLLPLIFHRLRRLAKCSCNKEQLKTRLARYCEIDIDPAFAAAMLSVCRGEKTLA